MNQRPPTFKLLKFEPPPVFKPKPSSPSLEELIEQQAKWVSELKKQARDNLGLNTEYMRISWSNRYKIPRHTVFGDYTPEELVLESWEQYYFETPNSLDLKGIHQKVNAKTGLKYYQTGDPVIDAFEEAFSRGETPDMSSLNQYKGGQDIFRSPVFHHTQKTPYGANPGDTVTPRKGLQGVQETASGDKITVAGAKVEHDDYSSDAWVKQALEDDPALRALSEKIGLPHGR